MHARVTPLHIRPDRIDESVAFIYGEVVPTFQRLRGFRGALWLHDPRRNLVQAINLWSTMADLERGDPVRFGWVPRTRRFLTQPPVPQIFDVRQEDRLVGIWDESGRSARVHVVRFQPGQLANGLVVVSNRLIAPTRLQSGYLGNLLLTSTEQEMALTISFWETADQARNVEAMVPDDGDATRLADLLAAPLELAIYEVTANG